MVAPAGARPPKAGSISTVREWEPVGGLGWSKNKLRTVGNYVVRQRGASGSSLTRWALLGCRSRSWLFTPPFHWCIGLQGIGW